MPDPAATTEEAPEEASWSGPVGEVRIIPVQGIPEIVRDCDLGAVIGGAIAAGGEALRDGDILAVTSKIASKALGLTAVGTDKRAVVREQSVRVVAERMTSTGATRIVEGRHGVVMAGAGIDASNTGPAETLLLLPDDPDEVSRELLESLTAYLRLTLGQAPDLGLVLTDTAGRPWRGGQTDFALGAAGLRVLADYRGCSDVDGRPLEVTAIAVADEIAAAADLVKGKLAQVPVAILRGLGHLVEPGTATGARRLVRTGPGDFFAMGHVEAARAALGVDPGSPLAEAAGIRSVNVESVPDRLARAVRVALLADPRGSSVRAETRELPDGRVEVLMTCPDAYAVGRATARLEVALWSEGLGEEIVLRDA